MSDNEAREFDIVLVGATGFVGRLTAAHLRDHAPEGTRIALAGRSRERLDTLAAELGGAAAQWPRIVIDVADPAACSDLASRTRVLTTTVGPYAVYGAELVKACAMAGTHYADLTGEVLFVRDTAESFHEVAQRSGARIVHSCGFDSIPSDLGVWETARVAEEEGAGTLTDTVLFVRKLRGGLSGGTIDSMRVIADEARNSQARRLMLNPQALSGGPGEVPRVSMSDEPSDLSIISAKKVDPSLRGTLAPFFMAAHNTRIVRRSNALLDNAYGTNFHYAETMNVGGVPAVSTLAAGAVAVGTGVFMGAMSFGPTRRLLDRVLPKPGDGPSEKSRNSGYFVVETFTRTTTGRRYRSQMRAQGDPGYKATAVMLAESALALALDRDRLPSRTGVLTTAAAMGDALIDRLRDAGFTIEATELG